jgi:phage tail-like protein
VAILRDDPYGAFNFLVSIGGQQGDGGPGSIVGGFAEVSGLGMSVEYAEYRNGNERVSTPRKIPGLTKVNDVTLKRGIIGSPDLFEWLRSVAQGTPDPRTVTITLLDGDRQPVVVWRLRDAQPAAWLGPSLRARDGALAFEEIRLVCEGLEME